MYFTLNDLYALIYMFINWYCMHSFPCDLNCILTSLCLSSIITSFNILIIIIKTNILANLNKLNKLNKIENYGIRQKVLNTQGNKHAKIIPNQLFLQYKILGIIFEKKNLPTHATCYPHVLSTSLVHNM